MSDFDYNFFQQKYIIVLKKIEHQFRVKLIITEKNFKTDLLFFFISFLFYYAGTHKLINRKFY